MPHIVIACEKGGVGRTTCAALLASQLAEASSVVLIDCTGDGHSSRWAKRLGKPESVDVVSVDDDSEAAFLEAKKRAKEAAYVVTDCTRWSAAVGCAMKCADFIVIPTRVYPADVDGARETIRLIQQYQSDLGRLIPYGVLINMIGIRTSIDQLRKVEAEFRAAHINMFETRLAQHPAFANFVFPGGLLQELDLSRHSVLINAEEFAEEVIWRLVVNRKFIPDVAPAMDKFLPFDISSLFAEEQIGGIARALD